MMGYEGLKRASEIAILNANYIAVALKDHYDKFFEANMINSPVEKMSIALFLLRSFAAGVESLKYA